MSTTITGKLNKPAQEFQAGSYTGFGIRLGAQYYDHESKSKQWTNYSAAFFSNNTQQIEYMRSMLVEGAIVEVTAKSEKIDVYQGNNGPIYSIKLLDCSLGSVYAPQGVQPQQGAQLQQNTQPQQLAPQAPQQPQQQPQQGYGQNQYRQAQQQPQNQMPEFGDSIPF